MFPLLKLYSTYFLLVYPYISTMLFRCIIYYNCPFPITHYITIRTSLLMYLLKILQGLVPVTLYCCTDPESFPDSRAQAEKKQKIYPQFSTKKFQSAIFIFQSSTRLETFMSEFQVPNSQSQSRMGYSQPRQGVGFLKLGKGCFK